MLKSLRSEFKDIKWLKKSDVMKQSGFVLGVIIVFSTIFVVYDTLIQKLISLFFN